MENFNSNLIISGSGGQGIQFIGKFLAQYFLELGYKVTYIPSYGAEMRGGPTDAQVKISSNNISMPVVANAEYVMFLSNLLLDKFIHSISNKTNIILNKDKISDEEMKIFQGSNLIDINANQISKEFGLNDMVNIPFIYKYLKLVNKFDMDTIKITLNVILAGKSKKLIEKNIEYFKFLINK